MKFFPKTIRLQIMMAFSVCFVFMALIIALNYTNFRRLSQSMTFFQLADDLNSTILEMRRYEKNYFLYRQDFNYEENVTYTSRLTLILQREREELIGAIGGANYAHFVQYARDYTDLMTKLHRDACAQTGCVQIQTEIRGVGQNLHILADQLVSTERRAIAHLLQQMVSLPLISLLVLVILLGFVIIFIGEKVVRPLARITRESEAVAKGAFHRITPHGGAENEIHYLVAALNRMMEELEKRQDALVQSRKIAFIGTLTASIAHEINNPVNNLSLILESLIEEADTMDESERRRLFEEAMGQADRTSEIVKNLLEFSRATHPRIEDVNFEELIDKTHRLLDNEMHLHNVTFVKEVNVDFPIIRMDRDGLRQVLLNLFMNGVQAMEAGGELKVVIDQGAHAGEARIDVIDTGVGIPPEDIERIFDPFFTTKEEGKGTGLGLSVCCSIIKKSGGRMTVESEPGRGSRFSIFLPLSRDGLDSNKPT